MAGKPSIPTDLFWDETFSGFSGDTQSIFIGLLLGADDHGRGPASVTVLSRKLAKEEQLLRSALEALHASAFIQCYQVQEKAYYHICSWDEWETLNKPARSRYPAPPEVQEHRVETNVPESLGTSQKIQETPEKSGKSSPEDEGEDEEKRREQEGEEEGKHSTHDSTVIPFPPARIIASVEEPSQRPAKSGAPEQPTEALAHQVAQILKIPVTDALTRIIAEYESHQGLSLSGEADAAREWIDDRRRNTKQQRMSPAFFRRWLKREVEASQQRQAHLSLGTGTNGPPTARTHPPAGGNGSTSPNLMHLAGEDKRAKEGKRP